jgi:hypothetical protein
VSFGVSFVSRLCGGDERSYRTLPLHRLQLDATLLEREQLCVKDILVSFAKKHVIPAASVPLLQLAARGVEGEAVLGVRPGGGGLGPSVSRDEDPQPVGDFAPGCFGSHQRDAQRRQLTSGGRPWPKHGYHSA